MDTTEEIKVRKKRQPRVTVNCQRCGTTITKRASAVMKRTFCSSKCRNGTPEQRFWDWVKVADDTDSCWEWQGSTKHGYGVLSIGGGKLARAHRFSWELHNGEINDIKMFVCHKCDNPACVRIDHLFLGTVKDNAQDCVSKGRNVGYGLGEECAHAKLTEEKVREIRRMESTGIARKQIAEIMDIKYTTIGSIIQGRAWKHVK